MSVPDCLQQRVSIDGLPRLQQTHFSRRRVLVVQRARDAQDARDVGGSARVSQEATRVGQRLELVGMDLPGRTFDGLVDGPVDVQPTAAVDDVGRLGQAGAIAELADVCQNAWAS